MVYVTGDFHGDFARFSSADIRKVKKGDTLIVCGDFGFLWNGGVKEKRLLKKLGKLPYTLLFLDGVHENYDLLAAYPVTEWNGGRVQVIEGNLIHLLRGEIYMIEGERYFVFGGGESSDHDIRLQAKTWWEAEMPSAEDMMRGLHNLEQCGNTVDYVLTHEPSGKASGYIHNRFLRLDGVNVYLNQIEENVTFRRWFFGSVHLDKPMSARHQAVFRQVYPVHPEHARKRR